MGRGKQQLRLIQGSIRPTRAARHNPQPPAQLSPSSKREPPYGDLRVALNATEQRLGALLQDRDRIGRDLHDCVLQSLYAIGLSLETSRRMNPDVHRETKRSVDHALDLLNALIHQIRRMIRGLETGTVQEFDLASELKALATTYEQIARLPITLDLQQEAIDILTSEEEQEILNIVREALSNCVRHAQATHATVSIRMRGTKVRVSVSDDGIGFVAEGGPPQGYGLANMEARTRKLGGTFRIHSKLGRGTQITADFVLEPVLTSL
jgi:signal transduction histidine kinase